jgi:hypothetical protein
MRQVLLVTQRHSPLIVWAPDTYQLGDKVRWNGSRWTVDRVYSTHFCRGCEAKKREKPDQNPLEKLN